MKAAALIDNLRVVLVATRNPLNIGAAARAMSNFGCTHLRLVNPYDPAYHEARSAVGAAPVLAQAEVYGSVAEAVTDCALVAGTTAVGHRELQHPLRGLQAGAREMRRHLGRRRVALLFGSEKFGLSNEDLSHCHWLLSIPTRDEHRSMNLGQAVAVCLYELVRDAKAAAKFRKALEKSPRANAAEVERFTTLLIEALRTSGFLDRRSVADADERIRRLVRRLNLPSRDADMWTGIMRQIVWKLNATPTKKPTT
ncbi:MAG: TrmJ/YjtD family RNA methyltransferase [Candidatus Acidiferrales bacterium]